MADYAYEDPKRTKIVYADASNITNYKRVRCWCKNPDCDAKMFIVKPEYPDEAFFRASRQTPHAGSCGSGCNHFDKKEFDPSLFKFPDVLENLEKVIEKSPPTTPTAGSIEVSTGNKPIKTLKQLYSMCTNTPIEDKYGGYRIGDMIADIRNFDEYLNGIRGYRIVECNFYKFDIKSLSICFNYPYFPQNKHHVRVAFNRKDLFKKMVDKLIPLGHGGIIVISGNWLPIGEEKVKSECEIHSEKQIAIIKKTNS